MLNEKLIYNFTIATLVGCAIVYFSVRKSDTHQEVNDTKETAFEDDSSIPLTAQRKPASITTNKTATPVLKNSVKRSELDKSQFKNTPQENESHYNSARATYQPEQTKPNNHSEVDSSEYLREYVSNTSAPVIPLKKENDIFATGALRFQTNPTVADNKKKTNVMVSSSSSGVSSAPTTANTCSADIIGGTFSAPLGVSLSCSTISTIKYCIGIDTGSGCCDPLSASTTYTTSVTVGPASGNYCLSFFGESVSNGDSPVYQNSYVLNTTLPNLLVAHPQTFYQTTQLNGVSLMTSSDFGKAGYNIGQINLKSHDPGPSGLNLDCEDIVTNYVALTAPTPLEVLTSLDVSLDNPALQIEIPLRLAHLDYGDNFITSYIENTNTATSVYSCSTSKIVLNDFEFFQETLAFGDAGDNSKREFSGGFSPFGFFEDDMTISRGPAGEQSEDNAGQKLQYGMFGMFF
jgi:hypothetical protein